jgi:hypothetical protein
MKPILAAALIFGATCTSLAGATDAPALFTLGETRIGGYLGIGAKYTHVDGDPAGFLDLRAAVTIDGDWAVGLSLSGLSYEKKLQALVTDGTYHLYAGYSGVTVERIMTFGSDVKSSVSLLLGQGETYYRYDNDYRKEKRWTEETIDRTTFSVMEPGIGIHYRLGGNFWLGATASYRWTSPVRMIGTSESIFRSFNAGLALTWGVF